MSAAKRKNMLVVFGGVAVVLAVALIFIAPNFRYPSEDASGAIGAVQKHRQPQIQSSDVVLGNEQVKKDQQIAYVDFLKDAAALNAISAGLESEAQTADARARMAAAVASLDARQNDLRSRALANAEAAMVEMRKLGMAEANLEAQDIEAVAAKMQVAVKALEAKAVSNRRLESAEAEVASFAARMKNQEALSLDAAERLENAIDADMAGARIRAQANYFQAMAVESKALAAASSSLAALQAQSLEAKALDARFRAISADLSNEAVELEAKALLGMEHSLESHGETMEALGRMDAQLNAAHSLDSRKLASAEQEYANMSRILKGHAANLQASANLEMKAQLAVASEHLDSHNLGNRSLAAFSKHLGSLSQSVENKSALASAVPEAAAFASQARQLAARAAEDLQSRSRQ